MADFSQIWNKTKSFEGGYQAMPNDSANYCPSKGKAGSQLIGTKFGISAIGYAGYQNGVCPTVNQIKNLTEDKAKQIAKTNYWNTIQGDKIQSQAIAHLIFDITYGGAYGPKQVRQAINKIKGKNTVKEFTSFTLSNEEVKIINSLPEKQFFDTLTQIRADFYKGNQYEVGLTNRLNSLKNLYEKTLSNKAVKIGLPIFLLGLIILGYYYFKK